MLSSNHVTKRFGARVAVDAVSLGLARGEILALVGRSGSGKSTLARLLAGMTAPDSGGVTLDGKEPSRGLAFRRAVQLLPQDVGRTLNPLHRIRGLLVRPMALHGIGRDRAERLAIAADLMRRVGLDPDMLDRLPHQLSGGQRQRVATARALAIRPDYLILDEPFSALDGATAMEVVATLTRQQEAGGFGLLLVTHDIVLARALADRIGIMAEGRLVGLGTMAELAATGHPETARLFEAAERQERLLAG